MLAKHCQKRTFEHKKAKISTDKEKKQKKKEKGRKKNAHRYSLDSAHHGRIFKVIIQNPKMAFSLVQNADRDEIFSRFIQILFIS